MYNGKVGFLTKVGKKWAKSGQAKMGDFERKMAKNGLKRPVLGVFWAENGLRNGLGRVFCPLSHFFFILLRRKKLINLI